MCALVHALVPEVEQLNRQLSASVADKDKEIARLRSMLEDAAAGALLHTLVAPRVRVPQRTSMLSQGYLVDVSDIPSGAPGLHALLNYFRISFRFDYTYTYTFNCFGN